MSSAAGVILWDFDGTLAHRPGLWRSSLLTALDQVRPGHGVTADAVRPGLKDGFPWHRPEIAHPELGEADAWWRALDPLLVRSYVSAGVRGADAERAAALVRTVFTDPQHWAVFQDTEAALTRLKDAGWRHRILSNHVPELALLVGELGLSNLVEEILTSAATGYEKPHPQAFASATEGLAPATPIWMVGDNPIADVSGAQAAGLRALLVRDRPEHDLLWAADQVLAAAPTQ